MRLFLGAKEDKEALAMMLTQWVESGLANPAARSALTKLHRAKGYWDSVDFNQTEVEEILKTYRNFNDDYYWTPRGYPPDDGETYYQRYPLPGARYHTRYLNEGEERQLTRELLETRKQTHPLVVSKLEALGVPEDKMLDLLEEIED